MNYLVHLYLSGSDPQHQLGGLMGDFVKGPIPDHYPAKIIAGLRLHRSIDSLAHNSSHTRQSRQRLQAKYGHGRGIIVDIFYDHFLASNWADYSEQTLDKYADDVYRLLQEHHDQLPRALQQIATRMIEHNWLVSYQHPDVVGRALQRIAQRLSRPLPLHEATVDLAQHQNLFFRDFQDFLAEAEVFARQQLAC